VFSPNDALPAPMTVILVMVFSFGYLQTMLNKKLARWISPTRQL
jgi:hypothetical protein